MRSVKIRVARWLDSSIIESSDRILAAAGIFFVCWCSLLLMPPGFHKGSAAWVFVSVNSKPIQ